MAGVSSFFVVAAICQMTPGWASPLDKLQADQTIRQICASEAVDGRLLLLLIASESEQQQLKLHLFLTQYVSQELGGGGVGMMNALLGRRQGRKAGAEI